MKLFIKKLNLGISIVALTFLISGSVHADVGIGDLRTAVQETLKERSRYTGKLDLYDEKADKVRNLKLIKLADEFKTADDGFIVPGEYRDFSTGDIVMVDAFVISEEDDVLNVESLTIVEVKKAAKADSKEDVKKDFTDEYVKAAIQDYVDKQSKFTNYFGVVDPETESLRKLTLVSMAEKVRKFGVLHINAVEFKDQETDETLIVDVTMESKTGRLKVKNTKIKSIKK